MKIFTDPETERFNLHPENRTLCPDVYPSSSLPFSYWPLVANLPERVQAGQ
jgi:hypothetical protein